MCNTIKYFIYILIIFFSGCNSYPVKYGNAIAQKLVPVTGNLQNYDNVYVTVIEAIEEVTSISRYEKSKSELVGYFMTELARTKKFFTISRTVPQKNKDSYFKVELVIDKLKTYGRASPDFFSVQNLLLRHRVSPVAPFQARARIINIKTGVLIEEYRSSSLIHASDKIADVRMTDVIRQVASSLAFKVASNRYY